MLGVGAAEEARGFHDRRTGRCVDAALHAYETLVTETERAVQSDPSYIALKEAFDHAPALIAAVTERREQLAAHAEGVAPAVIGRRIDALEERLGVKLLVRTTRRISLTHEGSAFLEDCQRLLADLASAEASVSAGGVKASGHLRITAPAGFGRRHVAALVPRFRAQHPEVTLSLNLSDRVVDIAAEGYDCAVRVGDLPDSALVSVRLADNRRLCVATPDYLKRAGTPKTPAELSRHACLTLSSDASQTRGWAFRVDGELTHLRPGGPLDCSDGQVLHDWCVQGLGIAWRSTWEVARDIAEGRLVSVLDEFAAPPNGIYAVFPQRRQLPLRVRLFIDLLRQRSRPYLFSNSIPPAIAAASIAAIDLLGERLDTCGVEARVGFGHAKTDLDLARDQVRNPAVLLLWRTMHKHRMRAEHVHVDGRGCRHAATI